MTQKTADKLDKLKELYAANYKENAMLIFNEPIIYEENGFFGLADKPNNPAFFTGCYDFLAGGDSFFNETEKLLKDSFEDIFNELLDRAIKAVENKEFYYEKRGL